MKSLVLSCFLLLCLSDSPLFNSFQEPRPEPPSNLMICVDDDPMCDIELTEPPEIDDNGWFWFDPVVHRSVHFI